MDFERIRLEPVWAKSEEEIWDEVYEPLEEPSGKKRFLKRIPKWSYAAGLLLSILFTCCFYTKTEETTRGELLTITLPDNSSVTLNAESKISYNPFLWFIFKKVGFEGEAFFEVKSGSRFSVQSGDKSVNVLGNTFNINARSSTYCVTCLTGQMKVCAGTESAVLLSNMQVTIHEPMFNISSNVVSSIVTGWMNGQFVFLDTPLQKVIAEVERQYNINVTPNYDREHLFTGNFSKTEKPEDVLEIIGKPFGITFSIE